MSYNLETGMYEGYIYKIYNDINEKLYIGQTTTTIYERWHGHMSAMANNKRYNGILYQAMRKYGKDKFHIEQLYKIECFSLDNLINELNIIEIATIKQFHSLYAENGYNFEVGGNNKQVPGRKVNKYDINLNFIESYISCQEAGRRNGIDGCTVYGCCRHDYYTASGFVWAFDGEPPVIPDYTKREEFRKKWIQMCRDRKLDVERTKGGYMSKRKLYEEKHNNKLYKLNWNGKRVFAYNVFGEIIDIYDDILYASEHLKTIPSVILKNLNGINLHYQNKILRYEDDSFDKFPRSKFLQPITIYDMQGNVVKICETIIDAERFVGVGRGEVLKTIKRGGSCHNYMFSFYGEPLIRRTYQVIRDIEMYDTDWNLLRVFHNIKEINDFIGIADCHHGLNKAIKYRIQYKNYYWKYCDEFAVNA